MNSTDLRPARDLARQYGVKCLVYGDPGMGKTPCLSSAPRPVLCATEPGLRSMTHSDVPTWEAYTPARIQEFFDWLFGSAEATNFDTVGIDSVSQYAEIVLAAELALAKDPRKAYGELSRKVYGNLGGLYFMRQKHVYITAKKVFMEEGTLFKARPYFPGKDLNVKVPHLYDEILHMEKTIDVTTGKQVPMFRTVPTPSILARDRTGQLAEMEPPNLTNLFAKAMQ